MRVSWSLNNQPVFQQATHFLSSLSWRSAGNSFMQQAQSWIQPMVKWVTKQEEKVPLFIKAQAEEKYLAYQTWRSDFRKQMRQLQQDIVAQYRRGVLISPEHLRAALLAQQASFDSDTVSPIYYTRHLKRLAQRLPRYAHTFDGVAAHFKEQLKAQPEEALRYFYNDVVNQLIDSSREDGTVTSEVRTALQAVLMYYQGLVPTALYAAVQNAIIAVPAQEEGNQARYQDVLKQLNALFLQALETDTANAAPAIASDALGTLKQSLTAGWHLLKAHPQAALLSAASTTVGAGMVYWLSQEGMPSFSMTGLDTMPVALPSLVSQLAPLPLPLAMSYLSMRYTVSSERHTPSLLPLTVPLMASWSSQWLSVTAQLIPERWVKRLDGLNSDDGYSVQQTIDGGYIVTGHTASYGAGSNDLWLSKWTPTGTLTWVRTLGGANYDMGHSVQQTIDGGYIVTGYTTSFGVGSGDLWLSKWAANGTLTWVRTLGGAGNDVSISVQQAIDGGYIVTGFTYSFGAGGQDLWLSKWAANGTLTWVRTLGGTGSDIGHSVQQTTDGGYIVSGSTASFGAGNYDLWLSKWAANGTLTWVRTLGGTLHDYGFSVQQTADGGYIVTSSTESFGAGSSDLWLSKWAADGTLTWVRTLGGTGNDIGSIGSSVQQTADGDYIVTGPTASFGAGNNDLWLSKWAANGTLMWVRTLGGTGSDIGRSVQQTTDGGYIVTGYTQSFGAGGQDLWLSKWDSQGSIDGNSCVLQPTVNSATPAVSEVTVTVTAATPSVTAQTPTVSAQTASPTLRALCNDAPVLTNSGGSFIYTENAAMVIDNSISVSDIDNTELISARVSISNGFASSQDVLSFVNQNGITGSYDSGTGVLALTGTSTVANYQTALRSVTYQNTSDNPSTSPRTFSFTVNDGELDSNVITRAATILAVDDAPILTNNGGGFIYTENNSAMVIDGAIGISDIDNAFLNGASVVISAGFVSDQDVLGFTDQNEIMGSYNSINGVLMLSGTSSVTNYQTALRTVTYQNTADNPSTSARTFSFTVNDGELNSNVITRTVTIVAVNDAPMMTDHQLTINQGETIVLTNSNLQATDVDTDPSNLQFTVSGITQGQFEQTTVSGTPIITFSQQAINEGSIRFVHDGSNQAPAFQVSVSDGELATSPVAATINFIPRSEFTPSFAVSAADNTALIAGLVSGAAALTIGVIGTSYCYIKKRQQQARASVYKEAGIEMVSTVRHEGYTVISGDHYHYALINKFKAKDAETLKTQTGIEVDLQGGKKAKLTLGQGKFGRLRLAKVVKVKTKSSEIAEQTYVGVKKIKGEKEIAASQAEASMQFKLKDKPHIMPLLDSVETVGSEGQKVLYQFMPLAGFGNGETLQAHLAKVSDETHKQRLLAHVAKGLLTGLTHMHDSQIYHLDVKPSNVVLTPQGEVSIIDFGCAQQLPHQQLSRGDGDTRYFSPERLAQCRQQQAGEAVTPIDAAKVDAWAMGVTLLEMSINRYPWEHKAAHERLSYWDDSYFARQLKQLSVLANPASGSYWAVVKGLLEPNPDRRLTVVQALMALVAQRQYDFSSLAAQQRAFQELKALPVTSAARSSTKEDQQQYAHLYLGHKGTGTAELSTVQASYSGNNNSPTASGTLQSSPRVVPSSVFFQPPKTNARSVQPVELSLEEREITSAHYQPQG